MSTIFTAPRHYILIGAILAMAAIILAVALTVGNTQAQTPPPIPTYEPPPCGPGFEDFHDLPDHIDIQETAGYYGIFDAYYDFDADGPHVPMSEGEPWAGTLNLNLCPPVLEEERRGRPPVTITTRQQADIDIGNTIFHVDQAAHTLTEAEVEFYPFLGEAGDEVYWLRVGDDPNTTITVEQASDLQLSFSTGLLDPKHWDRHGTDQPLWYEVETERQEGVHPKEYGHVYVFDDSDAGRYKEAIWDSTVSDTGIFEMGAGQYRKLQWVFTDPGTYVFSVHINGHVREDRPEDLPFSEVWHPISEEKVVTSLVRKYTFHVGPLMLNEQPMFKAPDRQIPENSSVGDPVGDPVPVAGLDSDTHTYKLSGDGHEDFVVESVAGGGQIRVAQNLDYETRAAYDLVLSVSDGMKRTGETDFREEVDSTIAVRITLEDVPE